MKKINITGINKRLFSIILSTTLSFTSVGYSSNEIVLESDLDSYKEYISNINPEYKNDEIYTKNVGLVNFTELRNTKKCPAKFDYKSDKFIDNLVETIKRNSNSYYFKNKSSNHHYDFESAFILDGDNNFNLKTQKMFEKALPKVLKKIIETSTNDIEEDICRMQTLKIVFTKTDKGIAGFYVNTENMLGLSRVMTDYGQEELEHVLEHELNHLRQSDCQHKYNGNYSLVPETLFSDDPWYMESSPDSFICNQNLDSNYKKDANRKNDKIKEESFLLLLGLFHDDVTLDDYYNAIFDNDIDKFMKFVGMKDDKDANEIYKIIKTSSAYIDDIPGLEELSGMNDSKKKVEIGYAYRVDIFKRILNNMIDYTYKHQDFTLEENLVIFNTIRNICAYDTQLAYKYSSEEVEVIFEDKVVRDMLKLDNKYNEFLCRYYNVSSDYIHKKYYNGKNINNVDAIMKEVLNLGSDAYHNDNTNYRYLEYNYGVNRDDYVVIKKKTQSLFKKFPILEAVAYSNYRVSGGYFSYYLKQNGLEEDSYERSPLLPYSSDYYVKGVTDVEHKMKEYSKPSGKMKK